MMWCQRYKMSNQRPVSVVHKQIAMQCARSMMHVANTLTQPPCRSPSGHVPILVELRRSDDMTVFLYQVNVPPSGWPQELDGTSNVDAGSDVQVLMLGTSMVPNLLNIPPCPMHGHAGLDSTTLPSAEPLVMKQSFFHKVIKSDPTRTPGNMITCCGTGVTFGVGGPIQEHFKACLNDEQPSPLPYSDIWLPDDPETLASFIVSASASTPSSSPISLSPRRSLEVTPPPRRCPQLLRLDENNEYVVSTQERPINGLRKETGRTQKEWASIPELCLDSNGEYVPNHLFRRPLNGCRPESSLLEQQPRQQKPPAYLPNGLNGVKGRNSLPKNLNGLNGFSPYPNGLKGFSPYPNGLNGFSPYPNGLNGFSPYRNGLIKNGYKPSADQRMAYTDQDKVMRLRAQMPVEEPPVLVPNRIEPIKKRMRHRHIESHRAQVTGNREMRRELQSVQHVKSVMQRGPREPLDKPPRPSVTDVVESSEALPQPHNNREPQTFFRWNYCTLCHTAMRTVRNAVDHYTSRTHDRRVSTFLSRLCFDKNMTLSMAMEALALPEPVLRYLRRDHPTDLYCDLCDLRLTSHIHAEQHFFGRRHQQIERQMAASKGHNITRSLCARNDTKLLMCEVCDVSITSESQMAMHISGARHRKRAQAGYGVFHLGSAPHIDAALPYNIHTNDGALTALRAQGRLPVPSSIQFRPWGDPSAVYYCETCNVTLNHLKSVKQHEIGRMHQRNMRVPWK